MSVYYSSIGKKILSSFLIGVSFLVIIVAGTFWNNLGEVKIASASVADQVAVTGYAWSSNIGWIKFDTGKDNPVKYDKATGQLSGYAWSSNIGWISFESNIKVDNNGIGGVSASANTTTGLFSGWGRACAGTADGKCNSMTSRTDGWDGWIKFDTGKSSPVKVDLTNGSTSGEFTGYAWGSEVVGWISFNCSNTNTCGTSDYKVKIPSTNTGLKVTCSASPNPVTLNTSTTFTATVSGGAPNYTYVWSGDVPSKTTTKSGLTDTNSQSYSSTETKNATIEVKDNSSPKQNAKGTCSVEVNGTVVTSSSSSGITTSSSSSSGGIAVCGNSSLESGETCDDGNTASGDGCSSACQDEVIGSVCGNSIVESSETCDDGNTAGGDGCSSVCQTESGGGGGNLLTVIANGKGAVNVKNGGVISFTCYKSTCSQSYSSGTKLKLTATPDSGATFTRWSIDCTNSGECSVTMDGARTVQADFFPDDDTVSSSSSSVAPPIDGACGTANKKNTKKEPGSSELCKEGTDSGVTETSDGWDWTCLGLNDGNSATCHAGKLEVIIQEI